MGDRTHILIRTAQPGIIYHPFKPKSHVSTPRRQTRGEGPLEPLLIPLTKVTTLNKSVSSVSVLVTSVQPGLWPSEPSLLF